MNPDFLFLSGYNKSTLEKPTLSINSLDSTTDGTTATFFGYILSGEEITQSGFCWNFLPNPTINNFSQLGGAGFIGPLESLITGLQKSTTYYVRAYAVNAAGIAYSDDLYFTTLPTTVEIGGQVWKTKNEDRTTYRDGTEIPEFIGTTAEWDALTTGYWCYHGKSATVTPSLSIGQIYGKLYNWYAVMGIWNEASKTDLTLRKQFAPSGYHVPSSVELNSLRDYLGGSGVAGSKLKEAGNAHFITNNSDATNSSGFTFLPGGQRDTSFGELYYSGGIWSSTDIDGANAWRAKVENDLASLSIASNPYYYGRSVRLMQDVPPPEVIIKTATSGDNGSFATLAGEIISGLGISVSGFCWNTTGTPTTLDSKTTNGGVVIGNISGVATGLSNVTIYYVRAYATNSTDTVYSSEISFETNPLKTDVPEIKIGTQIWAQNNLDTVSYLGTGTPMLTTQYLTYGNDPGNASVYGLLYNGTAARTTSLPPQGWRVPSIGDFVWLESELLGTGVAGGKMKSTGDLTTGDGLWSSPNLGATNITGFTGLPGGQYYYTTGFTNKGLRGTFWTTSYSWPYLSFAYLSYNSIGVTRASGSAALFYSIRLIKCVIELLNNPVTAIQPTQIAITTKFTPENRIAVLKETGVCWSTSPDPTIADNKISNSIEITPIEAYPAITNITNEITGLTENVNYYVRAYYIEKAIGTTEEKTYYGFNNFFTAKLNTLTGIKIGDQIWQLSNCNHTTYRDGTPIPEFVGTSSAWNNLTIGAWCYPNNNLDNEASYGKIYNWRAIAGIYDSASYSIPSLRKTFAPDGWKVPDVSDFEILTNYLEGDTTAGYKAKERGTTSWISSQYDKPGSNSSGFTARGAGSRNYQSFTGFRSALYLWTTTEYSSALQRIYSISANSLSFSLTTLYKTYAGSVRLIKI